MGEEDQRRRRPDEDRISGLPDELLHDILVRLCSAHAAARTSVLSRRWRHIWAHLPELRLVAPREAAPAAFINDVDAALGGYLGTDLEHLGVSLYTEQHRDVCIPAGRIAPWLHFAAEHVVGELNLHIRVPQTFFQPDPEVIWEEAVLELPLPSCERAQRIDLNLRYAYPTWLRPQASGLFTALTSLKIDGYVHVQGSDLTALVSTQCPCLMDLNLFIRLINSDIFMHSNSLHTLLLRVLNIGQLEVVAPRLEELTIYHQPKKAHISAPNLVKVVWYDPYDPHLNLFVDVGRTLRLLKTTSLAFPLTKRFDEVDELDLTIVLGFLDVATYERFLNGTNKLPKCKSFRIHLHFRHHALVPIMLHLLRSCICKKLLVHLAGRSPPVRHSCLPSCPCRLEESRKIDGIDLSSLEVVEISGLIGSREQMQLVVFLSSNAGVLKRLLINDEVCRGPKEAREKVRSICRPKC